MPNKKSVVLIPFSPAHDKIRDFWFDDIFHFVICEPEGFTVVDCVSEFILMTGDYELWVKVPDVFIHVVDPAVYDEHIEIAVLAAVLLELELFVYVFEPSEVRLVVLVTQVSYGITFRESYHMDIVDEVILMTGEDLHIYFTD